MRIHSINLSNFLCYYGTDQNQIDFDEGLNLILGANGYGKSKLYDAFQWVFKDGITDETIGGHLKKTPELKKDLISDKALAEANIGDNVNCEVIIEVSNGRDMFKLHRKYHVVKQSAETWKEANASSLIVYKKDILDFKPLDDDQSNQILQKLIPDDVMPYVWFQGERGVNSIIDTSSKDSLKRVIERLSDIENWDQYIAIAQKAHTTATNQFNQALKTTDRKKKELGELILKQSETKRNLDICKIELENAQRNLELVNEKSNSVMGKLASANKIKDLEQRRGFKIKESREVTNQVESFHLNFTKSLFSEFWLLMNTEALVSKFEEKYKKYSEYVGMRKAAKALANESQSRMPRGVPERMHVQKMLEKEWCLVCNREAKKGTPEYKAIEQLLPEMTSITNHIPDIEPELRKLWNIGFNLSDKFQNADREILNATTTKKQLIERQKELKEEIDSLTSDINNEILNSGVERAVDIIAMSSVSYQDSQKYSQLIGKLGRDKEAFEKTLKEIELKLKELSVGEVDPVITKKMDILQDLSELTIRIKDAQYKGLVELLERTANEHYERINKPTGAFYGKIKFVPTTGGGFVPEIFNDQDERVSNLNTSQTSSLKLAIIMAIVTANNNRAYAVKYPLILDAPISDFDEKKKKSFLVEAANTFTQSIIIVMDYLIDDPERVNRYMPDKPRLKDLNEAIEIKEKNLKITQLDIPNGIATNNRKDLVIKIKPVSL